MQVLAHGGDSYSSQTFTNHFKEIKLPTGEASECSQVFWKSNSSRFVTAAGVSVVALEIGL